MERHLITYCKLLQQLPDYGDELMTYAEELRREGRKLGVPFPNRRFF
ncbi:hypothetical protein [Aquella oligotrophica]|nr:hypothetical protein [Aquella oligotrophica]